MRHVEQKHTVKGFRFRVGMRWAWQCGKCDAGNWEEDWATAWDVLEGHVRVGHPQWSFRIDRMPLRMRGRRPWHG